MSIYKVNSTSSTGLKVLFFFGSEIQLKSPNWLFGQRKLEGSGAAAKVTTNETANREVHRETRGDNFCDLNWLSSADDINDEDIFQR